MSGTRQIRTFRDLDVWTLAMDVVVEAYVSAGKLPRSEEYGLSSQIRRSAVSVPSNIAEGHTRRGRAYRHHARVALGSTAELDTQIELAIRLGFLSVSDVATLVQMNTRVAQMLYRLSESLRREQWANGYSLLLVAAAGCAALFHLLG